MFGSAPFTCLKTHPLFDQSERVGVQAWLSHGKAKRPVRRQTVSGPDCRNHNTCVALQPRPRPSFARKTGSSTCTRLPTDMTMFSDHSRRIAHLSHSPLSSCSNSRKDHCATRFSPTGDCRLEHLGLCYHRYLSNRVFELLSLASYNGLGLQHFAL